MKTFLVLFKTGSIPFSSSKIRLYKEDWANYINELKRSNKLVRCSFLKQGGTFISGKKIDLKSYIPHKDIFSGFMIINSDDMKEAKELCADCPVFKRNGDIQIKEFDENYIQMTFDSAK